MKTPIKFFLSILASFALSASAARPGQNDLANEQFDLIAEILSRAQPPAAGTQLDEFGWDGRVERREVLPANQLTRESLLPAPLTLSKLFKAKSPAQEPDDYEVRDVSKCRPQSGLASWYGDELQGTQTASGERFNTNELTAANKILPFGTRVRVTNRRNGLSIVVRINDRGPFVAGRVIDLSRAAAAAIRIDGVGPVELTCI